MQEQADWRRATKKQLLDKLLPTLDENRRLRESVERLMKCRPATPAFHHAGRPDDFVPAGWPERHGVVIPRADGYFESPKAWLRVTHGVITNAGLKNQSILSLMTGRRQIDEGGEKLAYVYVDWRAAFFARVEAARYSDEGTGDPDAWSKEDRYSKLLKAVDRRDLRRVDTIVTSRPKEKDVASYHARPAEFIASFQNVVQAMLKINQDAARHLSELRRDHRPVPA